VQQVLVGHLAEEGTAVVDDDDLGPVRSVGAQHLVQVGAQGRALAGAAVAEDQQVCLGRGVDPDGGEPAWRKVTAPGHEELDLEEIINYATPGYATSVFVVAQGIQRIRTTAESHRRIAIIEVMGRQSGYIALGSAFGQPDIILIPEVPLDVPHLEQRVRELYELQTAFGLDE
jgi:hypothetical protein